MNDDILKVFNRLPYKEPFLFVDEITKITDQEIWGEYTFLPESYFYKGHFDGNPITPGVLLLEAFAQLGGVAHGIFLLNLHKRDANFTPIFTSAECEFLYPVSPGETIRVFSNKVLLRNNYLKIKGYIVNSRGEVVFQGTGICKFIIE